MPPRGAWPGTAITRPAWIQVCGAVEAATDWAWAASGVQARVTARARVEIFIGQLPGYELPEP